MVAPRLYVGGMEAAATVTTTKRDQRFHVYIYDTLLSLDTAGFSRVRVFDDEMKIGCNRTYRAALRDLLDNCDNEAVIVFQDDLLVAKGLKAYVDRMEWPAPVEQMGVVSLYCAGPHAKPDRGLWRFPLSADDSESWAKVYGALAFVWPRAAAEKFLADPPAVMGRSLCDQLIGAWCAKNDLQMWVHSPSLIQHIGKVSSFGPVDSLTKYRVATDFVENIADWK